MLTGAFYQCKIWRECGHNPLMDRKPSTHDIVNLYFTRQIIGPVMDVQLGPSEQHQQLPKRGVMLDFIHGTGQLLGMSGLSLLQSDPLQAVGGHAINWRQLRNWRKAWVIFFILIWTGIVALCTVYVSRLV